MHGARGGDALLMRFVRPSVLDAFTICFSTCFEHCRHPWSFKPCARLGGRSGRLKIVHLKPAGRTMLRRCLLRAGRRHRVKTFRLGTSRPFRMPPK